jgi:peptidyl-Lys metalloendopeptidase
MNITLSIVKVALIVLITTGITTMSACNSENAGNSIAISLSAEPSYKAKEAIVVAVSVTNNTQNDIRFLKWGTPFESMPTRDMFSVKKADNQILSYQGRMVKRGKPEASDYISIQAGQTLKQGIDISRAYGINASGTYHVQYKESYPVLEGNASNGMLTLPPTNSVSFQLVE